jgi:hypothetical protein
MQKTLLFSTLVLLILSGCKSKQQLVTTAQPDRIQGTTRQIIEQTQQAEPQFGTANFSKMSLNLSSKGKSHNLSASCKIIKDSTIHLSILVPFLGSEIFKAEFTTANIRLFDKMNNSYYEADYNFIEDISGVAVDFFAIQALFSNTFFTLGCPTPCVDKCKTEDSQIIFEKSGIKQNITIDKLYRINTILLTKKNQGYLSADYKDFAPAGKSNFSFPQQIKILAGDEDSQVSCVLNISRVEFDSNITLNTLNTYAYKKGNISDLLKTLQ